MMNRTLEGYVGQMHQIVFHIINHRRKYNASRSTLFLPRSPGCFISCDMYHIPEKLLSLVPISILVELDLY